MGKLQLYRSQKQQHSLDTPSARAHSCTAVNTTKVSCLNSLGTSFLSSVAVALWLTHVFFIPTRLILSALLAWHPPTGDICSLEVGLLGCNLIGVLIIRTALTSVSHFVGVPGA